MRWFVFPHTRLLRGRLRLVLLTLWLVMGVAGSTTVRTPRAVDIGALMAQDVCVAKQPHNMASSLQPQCLR